MLEPEYVIPCRKTISGRIHAMHNNELEKVKKTLSSASDIALTTDCWTSRATRSYMGLTAHYLDSNWTPRSLNLLTEEVTESQSAANLEDSLRIGMEEWEITEKVSTVVHDNAKNITNAVRGLSTDGITSHPCSAHTLQLIVNLGMKLPQCAEIIQKVSKLVTCFKNSSKRTYALEKHLTQTEHTVRKLIQSCPTRWNSALFMLERVKELRSSIVAVIADRSVFDNKTAQNIAISDSGWDSIDVLIYLLTPFQIATTVLSSDSEITISKVKPIIHKIITKHMRSEKTDTKLAKTFKEKVVADLRSRFHFEDIEDPTQENISIAHLASFLDPRFKQLKYVEYDAFREEIKNYVKKEYNQIGAIVMNDQKASTENNDFTALDVLLNDNESDTSEEDEFQHYVIEEQINHNLSVSYWCKDHEKIYPKLSKLAKRYLAVPEVASTASEMVFSSSGNVVRPTHNCLCSEMISALVFLHQNKKK
ncbi:PREDICTED: zinc finger BED domain-containing protein 1-like [Rhagoletis zephyria]|uniref:zinc finger BED domain-containing protein 1-like n=1 Tax=Rhagoletis zephyria TaxID=28612 RepID=UPI00081170FE|nr:PREDICTED: zinc finger BED domain-containing protein 1-like [Rhagoletis zephyria]